MLIPVTLPEALSEQSLVFRKALSELLHAQKSQGFRFGLFAPLWSRSLARTVPAPPVGAVCCGSVPMAALQVSSLPHHAEGCLSALYGFPFRSFTG
jgi:hypothetical protein